MFIGYFRVEIKKLDITVGGKDAAEVGKTYGIIVQAVPLLIELLDHKTHLKKLKNNAVSVKADFLLEKTKFQGHFFLKLPLNSILKVGCHALVWFIKQKIMEAKRDATGFSENSFTPSKKQTAE